MDPKDIEEALGVTRCDAVLALKEVSAWDQMAPGERDLVCKLEQEGELLTREELQNLGKMVKMAMSTPGSGFLKGQAEWTKMEGQLAESRRDGGRS